jgi:hypothetical protein
VFGGGIGALDSTVVLSNNVRIHSCTAMTGGAIAAQRSTVILRDRVAIGNTNVWQWNLAGLYGGGIYANSCTTLLKDVEVVCGALTYGSGGGLCILGTGACIIADSIIAHNIAGGRGGGIDAGLMAGTFLLDHVVVTGNTANFDGGGICWRGSGALTASNGARIVDNRVLNGRGGGAYLESGGPHVLRNLDFSDNECSRSGGGLCMESSVVNSTACVFDGNRAMTETFGGGDAAAFGGGGAAVLPGGTLAAYNCTWRNNRVDNQYGCGGALHVRGSAVTIDSIFSSGVHAAVPPTQFVGNRAGISNSAGGAVFLYDGAAGSCAHAFFASNRAVNGGALSVNRASLTLENSVFTRNTAGNGGGAMLLTFMPNQPLVRHCTFVENYPFAAEIGAATAQFQNCIMWGNLPQQIAPGSHTAVLAYCDIEGGYAGAGNIDSNPVFVAAALLNYDIAADSPCRDAGMALAMVTNDCVGNPRPYGPAWDMGAYEFVPEPGVPGPLLLLFVIYILQFCERKKNAFRAFIFC